MKQLEPYEQRMVDEYEELRDRRERLADFLKPELDEFFNDRETRPSKEELAWMTKQVWAMDDYLLVLKNRMKLHGIDPDEKMGLNDKEENSSVLFDQQVCDAFASAYETTDTTRGERERLFWEWLNAEKAKAWREGALSGFSQTGEGWNGEYADGPDPDVEVIVDGFTNPYKTKEC